LGNEYNDNYKSSDKNNNSSNNNNLGNNNNIINDNSNLGNDKNFNNVNNDKHNVVKSQDGFFQEGFSSDPLCFCFKLQRMRAAVMAEDGRGPE
jgi:hypothetical protein